MKLPKHFHKLTYITKWLFISALIAVSVGSASAFFLASLDAITTFRRSHTITIAFLPIAGFLMVLMYKKLGAAASGGTDLLIDTISEPKERVPFRMAPFILLSTLATHLCGGSAGREGTGLQMAGAIVDQFARPLKLTANERKTLMIAGIAAGFGSVFGTPVAGAVFALEFSRAGRISHEAIYPAFASAILADVVTRMWGIEHASLSVPALPPFEPIYIAYAIACGIACGACAILFILAIRATQRASSALVPYAPLRAAIGGVLIAGLFILLGSARYAGLGTDVILECFSGLVLPQDFALKLAFTALTLGTGFKGGEVTPLFFVGATLGNALSRVVPLDPALLSACGLVAVFAGASNTPLACTVLAFELFGPAPARYCAIACIVSYIVTGRRSLYGAQNLEQKSV